MKKYVAYFRVSTAKQGVSGLGLDAQKQIVSQFVKCKNNDCIVAEFTDIASGKNDNNPEYLKALDYCKQHKATLIVAKLDRISRKVKNIFELQESNVNFVVCDMPTLSTLNLGIFATIAQHERELISERTKAALAAKKARGFKLGSPANLTDTARLKAYEATKTKASDNVHNRKAKAFIQALESQNLTLRQIAEKLNTAGFKTSTGKDFTATQVMRLQDK